MALAPLATDADLQARGVDTTNTARVAALLAAASAEVRSAAGVPISKATATVSLPTPEGRRLALPGPVRSVTSVAIDGEPVDDWKLSGGAIWRPRWRRAGELPGDVHVTLTFGLDEVPADVVDLVCNLVGAGLEHADAGYAARSGVTSEREHVDDYDVSVQYAQGGAATATPMELPDATRRRLRARFGGGAVMVVSRS
ncbi:hypothetical protein [Prauserella muralis]|uniref:Uncharacterized protein n=1 Tax=Prauserella muralis TaxID=588067 RepID=A0A2V4ALL0_9PSEU|nr:hypothetical protein [Prauserella muralis]PXY20883.1 hypothetical protein BAY60_25605 [Prauserella muralis]TWE29924.1 hypothetical protein FHX69_2617 [Prauserella muralis]